MVLAPEAYTEMETSDGKSKRSLNSCAWRMVMYGWFFVLYRLPATWTLMPRLTIENVLAPMLAKVLLMLPLMESMAVRIPTSAIMPRAIIRMVSIDRRVLERIALNEIRKFSRISATYFMGGFGLMAQNSKLVVLLQTNELKNNK
jgi:hypothetical protein